MTKSPFDEIESTVERLLNRGHATLFQTRHGVVVALANTQEATNVAILLTCEPSPPRGGSPSCRHHWLLEPPNGELTRGVCKLCSGEKYFTSGRAKAPTSKTVVWWKRSDQTV